MCLKKGAPTNYVDVSSVRKHRERTVVLGQLYQTFRVNETKTEGSVSSNCTCSRKHCDDRFQAFICTCSEGADVYYATNSEPHYARRLASQPRLLHIGSEPCQSQFKLFSRVAFRPRLRR